MAIDLAAEDSTLYGRRKNAKLWQMNRWNSLAPSTPQISEQFLSLETGQLLLSYSACKPKSTWGVHNAKETKTRLIKNLYNKRITGREDSVRYGKSMTVGHFSSPMHGL